MADILNIIREDSV
jgi:coatomer subunit beta